MTFMIASPEKELV